MVLLGFPAEFVFDFGGIDRVAQVMPRAVGDKSDEGLRGRRSEVGGQMLGAEIGALRKRFI